VEFFNPDFVSIGVMIHIPQGPASGAQGRHEDHKEKGGRGSL